MPPGGSARQHGLQRTGFIGHVTKYGAVDELRRLLELIHAADFPRARDGNSDFVAFHCRECNRSYCERCWRIGPPEFDEGFYDYTSGTCPEGHEQIVDD